MKQDSRSVLRFSDLLGLAALLGLLAFSSTKLTGLSPNKKFASVTAENKTTQTDEITAQSH